MTRTVLEWLGLIGAALLALAAIWRATRPFRTALRKAGAAVDIVLGKGAEVDPISNRVIHPAVPDIGTRMHEMDQKIDNVVLSVVDEAARSAAAARAAAEAAAASAHAAEEAAATARADASETRGAVARLSEKVSRWQNVDRVQAETMKSAVTELLHPPHVDPPELAH